MNISVIEFSIRLDLLFLFGVKKKKITKRKNAGFRFEAATKRFPTEAQELANAQTACASYRRNPLLRFSPQN